MFTPLVVRSGFVSAASVALWVQVAEDGAHRAVWAVAIRALLAGLVGGAALPALRYAVLRVVRLAPLSHPTRSRYERWEEWTYVAFALAAGTALGLQLIMPVVIGIVALFLIAQGVLLRPSWEGRAPDGLAVGVLFLLSGAAALMYQVVWQRLLFGALGVNIESVTIVVSIFMLGLGLGSLAGGRLSLRYAERLPSVFAVLELCIAAFGAVSIPLISILGDRAAAAPLPAVALSLMLLLLLPTLLMGATLPVLVAHVNRTFADVGRSVGTLYFVNTLGSAIACFATVLVLFAFVGLRTTVYLAVGLNVAVAVLVSVVLVHTARDGVNTAQRFRVAVLLAAVTGWISLSHEILWVRVISSAWRNSPMAFGTTLGSFLVGVACGALIAPGLQRRLGWSALGYSAACLGLAGLLFWLLPGLASVVHLLSEALGILSLHAAVALVAALMGGLLPMVARHGVAEGANVGANVSVIYFANVFGATVGPLFTGFLLLEWLSVERAIFVVGLAGLLAAIAIAWIATRNARLHALGIAATAALLMTLGHGSLYDGFAERLHFRIAAPELRYAYQAFGRAGGIGVRSNGELFSDGLYDGGYNVNPSEDANGILRAYFLPVLHPNPRRVLEIGLGSGSWANVIASHPDVESLTVVEINPRYVDAMQRYPAIAATLGDPKVTLAIDDGRRWLRRHPHDAFDAIVVNGTWHWRASATHLLSAEFLRELRAHLAPGGLVYFNTTGSADAMRTAAAVFAHVVAYENFVAASDRVFEMSAERRLDRLRRFPVFLDSISARAMRPLLAQRLVDIAAELRATEELQTITEDNMATEFKTNWSGKWWRELSARAFVPERGWLEVLFP